MGIVGLRLLPLERCGRAKADWSPGKRVCAKRGRVPVGVFIGTQRARSSPVGFRPDPQYVDEVGHWVILSASQRLDPVDEHHRCLVGRRCVRRPRCMDRSVERHVNASPPAFPGDSPGNADAPVRRFHLQHSVVRNREKERAFRVSYQVLNAPLERTSEGDHIPRFH